MPDVPSTGTGQKHAIYSADVVVKALVVVVARWLPRRTEDGRRRIKGDWQVPNDIEHASWNVADAVLWVSDS